METLDTYGMTILRGTFSVPAGTPDRILERSYLYYGRTFVEAMEKKGWELKTKLAFYPNLSSHNINRKHIGIIGYFKPRFAEKEWVFEGLPNHIATRVLEKYGRKARIL